jgi:hypothetical protein
MPSLWTRDFLTRRIDRCYLIATWAKVAERRETYLARARHYRALLARMPVRAFAPAA